MNRSRRQVCAGAAAGLAVLLLREVVAADGGDQVIKIVARKFSYTPSHFTLKQGQPALLEFTALDFMHGFSIPDLKIRADLIPGQVTRVNLPPLKSGSYAFLCDNFCGDGHEQMHGEFTVR